ncbi:MAG TPA: CinA family protein [Streptosporangiaceae bacterium]|nr:CinA family protein [Streptosporangiaceae bacterium]
MTAPGSARPAVPIGRADLPEPAETAQLARLAIELLTASGRTVAVAESLTGGLVTGALTTIAGASLAVRGGVVAYATELKAALLGVPADLLARRGPVDADVAQAMAEGVRRLLGATYGLATTGVAGPGPADGKPQGTVFVAIAGPADTSYRGLELAGDRREVRDQTVRWALSLLVRAVREDVG